MLYRVNTTRGEILSLLAENSQVAEIRDPGPADDESKGFDPGSKWYNVSAGILRMWECMIATTGAAQWVYQGSDYAQGGTDPPGFPSGGGGGGMTEAEGDARYLQKAGGVMTGGLAIYTPDPLTLGGGAGTANWATGGVQLTLTTPGAFSQWITSNSDTGGGTAASEGIAFWINNHAGGDAFPANALLSMRISRDQVLVPAGNAGAPSLGFGLSAANPMSQDGFYLQGPGVVSLSLVGVSRYVFGATALTIPGTPTLAAHAATKGYVDTLGAQYLPLVGGRLSGPLIAPGGTAPVPAISFDAAGDTGFFLDGRGIVGLSIAGTLCYTFEGNNLLLPADPGIPGGAATKRYVDNLVASMNLYCGMWSVAANTPNIITAVKTAGDYWLCTTVDPAVPELAPAGIPGIGGLLISEGDKVYWEPALGVFQRMSGGILDKQTADSLYMAVGSGISQPAADGRYLQIAGGTMTGGLNFGSGLSASNADMSRHICLYGNPLNPTFNSVGFNVRGGGQVLQIMTTQSGNIELWNGNARSLVINWETLMPQGDVLMAFGKNLILSTEPTLPTHATTKAYVDAAIAAGGGGGGLDEATADGLYIRIDGTGPPAVRLTTSYMTTPPGEGLTLVTSGGDAATPSGSDIQMAGGNALNPSNGQGGGVYIQGGRGRGTGNGGKVYLAVGVAESGASGTFEISGLPTVRPTMGGNTVWNYNGALRIGLTPPDAWAYSIAGDAVTPVGRFPGYLFCTWISAQQDLRVWPDDPAATKANVSLNISTHQRYDFGLGADTVTDRGYNYSLFAVGGTVSGVCVYTFDPDDGTFSFPDPRVRVLLSGDPTLPLGAATKQYVDTITSDFLRLDGTSGPMTGNFVIDDTGMITAPPEKWITIRSADVDANFAGGLTLKAGNGTTPAAFPGQVGITGGDSYNTAGSNGGGVTISGGRTYSVSGNSPGGNIQINGGRSNNFKGGDVTLAAGQGGTFGGNVNISAGLGVTTPRGDINLNNLPTVPQTGSALWNNAGAINIGAGTIIVADDDAIDLASEVRDLRDLLSAALARIEVLEGASP